MHGGLEVARRPPVHLGAFCRFQRYDLRVEGGKMAPEDIRDPGFRSVYEQAYRIVRDADPSTTVRFADDGNQLSERRLERGEFTVTEDGLRMDIWRGNRLLFRASPDYCNGADRFMHVPDCQEALNALTF
jgi:hypothetical protein